MKSSEAYDICQYPGYSIEKRTRNVANLFESECQRTEYYLLKLFHETLLPPDVCTKDIVADIATLLANDLNYYKYTN